ncbi:PaaX family transcriptional regulator C-terminal domain-containing protein [Leifsonia sp. PS1209]|uniref:PaaX family transcriptional regulator n=1 Tax=Leifsonia sp. PS1209 TaxID=2724914 RepID=UPI001442D8A5|nr:PaaX family transcriptional regulator C-terminal domain-containing protein [Leifsonia sp. PS1209]QJA00105.1 hypothetical protein HF024_17415 [Leifsonia sp. PS1209]
MTDLPTAAVTAKAGTPPPDTPREDLEASTGSSTALLRTIVGSVLRPIGGWMSASGAVDLLGALGIPASTARSSLARLCARGVLERRSLGDAAGYALDPGAFPMLERGDARIFTPVDAEAPASWCLVSFSLPEHQRARRHQLRRRLSALGCGTVADGLWIAPARLEAELSETIDELGMRDQAVLFTHAIALGNLSDALPRWYDLEAIRAAYDGFLARHAHPVADPDPTSDTTPRDAFARWVRALDEWRVIPYLDPGLPLAALPSDWPGAAASVTFAALRARLEPVAISYAAAVAAPDQTAPPPARANERAAAR